MTLPELLPTRIKEEPLNWPFVINARQRAEGVTGGQRLAGTGGEPRHGLGQFRFGGLLQRAGVRCFLGQETVVGRAVVHRARLTFGPAAPP